MNFSNLLGGAGLALTFLAATPASGQSVEAIELFRQGAAALADGNLERASTLLEASYEESTWALRSSVAFLWGLTVFRQAQAMIQQNADGEFRGVQDSVEALERSQEILRHSRDPRAAALVEEIRQYLASSPGPIIASRQ